tara:strand:- start:201 stop:635 length:435 start_codon:yes stop_codon:yes gene_type:complete
MSRLGEPYFIPYINLPEAFAMPLPTINMPNADIPSYKPLTVPPSDLRPPPGITSEEEDMQEATPSVLPTIPKIPEIRNISIPGADFEIPLPSNAILITASSTAAVSVAATLTATALFKRVVTVMKPVIKQVVSRIQKKFGRPQT